jgi:chromosomal replication initiator protein
LFFYEWLEEHYVNLVRKPIKHELWADARLEYNIVVDNANANSKAQTIKIPASPNGELKNPSVPIPVTVPSSIRNPFVIPGLKKINIDSQLNSKYSFDPVAGSFFWQLPNKNSDIMKK